MPAQSVLRGALALAGVVAVMFASAVFGADKMPPVSTDGLHLVKQNEFAAVYLKPGAKFAQYDKVAILACFVAFQKDWQQNMDAENPLSIRPDTILRIKSALAAEFLKVFTRELAAGGFPVVTDAANDVLVLRPAIVNLQMAAPDPMQADPDETVFAQSAGQMTLYLELYDSVTSDLLARVIDPEGGRSFGTFGWQNSTTNLAAADEILKKWSDTLRQYLEHARGQG